MPKIGVLSDTHGYLDPQVFSFFKDCDEIWHAGDIGSLELVDSLKAFKSLKNVHGNIDDHIIQRETNRDLLFNCGGHLVFMTHIAGPFGSYNAHTRKYLMENHPSILICGHSHLLKIAYDQKYQLLYINPGACGFKGVHQVRTLVRFQINNKDISGMEIYEFANRFPHMANREDEHIDTKKKSRR